MPLHFEMAVDTGLRSRFHWYSRVSIVCAVVGTIIVLALVATSVFHKVRDIPVVVGGYCAVFATALSAAQILEHLSCFADADAQCKVVRILFMVPLYAVISYISILAPNAAPSLNLVRDAYEAYAIYAFFALMLCSMGGMDALYRELQGEPRPPLPHVFPLCHLKPMNVSPLFVQRCRLSLFQFMILKPLVTLVVFILAAKDLMGNKIFDLTRGYFWTAVVYNISISVAFTALLYFYLGLRDLLKGTNVFAKFLCIKAVIFLSYWQGIVIMIANYFHLLPQFDYWDDENVAEGLQDLLVCCEMLGIAFAHKICFGTDEYSMRTGGDFLTTEGGVACSMVPPARRSIIENVKLTLRHEDIISDLKDILGNR